MMKNRNIKSKILTVYIYTMLLSFGTWLLGGVVYNFCYREEINDNLITLQLELKYIANLQNHKLQNTGLTNSKTLIAKSIVGEFTDQHNTPQVIRNFYYEYFNTHGWIIKESRNYPKFISRHRIQTILLRWSRLLREKINGELLLVIILSLKDINYKELFRKYEAVMNFWGAAKAKVR